MRIKDALPARKVQVVIFAKDNKNWVPIFRGSSEDKEKLYSCEYQTVAPSQGVYKFYME